MTKAAFLLLSGARAKPRPSPEFTRTDSQRRRRHTNPVRKKQGLARAVRSDPQDQRQRSFANTIDFAPGRRALRQHAPQAQRSTSPRSNRQHHQLSNPCASFHYFHSSAPAAAAAITRTHAREHNLKRLAACDLFIIIHISAHNLIAVKTSECLFCDHRHLVGFDC